MLSPWFGASSAFSEMDAVRREMNALLRTMDHGRLDHHQAPDVRVEEDEEVWRVLMDVPGLSADDIEVVVQASRLTLGGTRDVSAPEGYKVHRRERRSLRFSQSFRLPATVDADQVVAEVREGVLTVTLPKVPAVQPRQITVQSA